jgi:methionine aminopeptidase
MREAGRVVATIRQPAAHAEHTIAITDDGAAS